MGQSRPHVATAETNKRGDLLLWNRSQGGVGGVLDHMGNSADQISLPWVIMEGKYRLCCSTKVVQYYPNVCVIDDCLEYLYTMQYGRIPCGTHWVSAVIVVVVLVVVIVIVQVVVAVVVPAI